MGFLFRFIRFLFFPALFLATLAVPVSAAETIKRFSVDIKLETNGTVDVTETIQVRAEGVQIKRGIFRDIPTVLVNDDGSVIRSNLQVVSVLRDGRAEPYFTENITNGIRIYIGQSSVFLEPGTYTYTLRYTMTRMGRYFADHDELYWNATGNFWSFPIEQALAQVTLPDGAVITELNAYTGAQGSNASDAKFSRTSDNTAVFRATRSFGPREGMTISVSFEKGVMAEPSGWEKLLYFVSDHRNTILPLVAVFVVLLYYFLTWNAVGRDPEKGVIVPLFNPPEGFSPALVHYIHNMGWKKSGWTAFSAALISLATKGLLEITQEKKKVTLNSLGQPEGQLPPGEKVIDGYLRPKSPLKINKSSGRGLANTKSKFVKAIQSENQNAYFFSNSIYMGIGFVLSIACIIGLMAMDALSPTIAVSVLMLGLFMSVFVSAAGNIWSSSNFGKFVFISWFAIAGVNLVGSVASTFSSINLDTATIAAVSIVLINLIFLGLMRAPTVLGRKIMDQIEGFKMYLETAESERLNFSREPDFSIRRFEEILPYAVALGVEKPWADRLSGELARNAIKDVQGEYNPAWYHGSRFSSRTLSKNIAGISSGVSAAMISAQPSSSSSSGGGGGGFSGGGGGGGGGGGW